MAPPVARARRGAALVAVAAVLATSAAVPLARAEEERQTRIYHAQHRSAEELRPLADASLAGRGSALPTGRGNSLALIGEPGAVREALRLLEELDRSPRSVVLHYEAHRREEIDAAGVRVRWSTGTGSLRVGTLLSPPEARGARIVPRGTHRAGDVQLSGTLRLLEGASGRIATGTLFPVVLERHRPGAVFSGTALVSAESGFEARPRVLGDGRVQIQLGHFSVDRSGGVLQTQAAETTVLVRPGETIAIGSIGGHEDRRELGLDGASSRTRSEDTVLLLRAELE